MSQITSAMAAKQLRKLNEQRDALLAMEKKARTFTAAIQEDVQSVRPVYDFAQTQDALVEIEEKIRSLKHRTPSRQNRETINLKRRRSRFSPFLPSKLKQHFFRAILTNLFMNLLTVLRLLPLPLLRKASIPLRSSFPLSQEFWSSPPQWQFFGSEHRKSNQRIKGRGIQRKIFRNIKRIYMSFMKTFSKW